MDWLWPIGSLPGGGLPLIDGIPLLRAVVGVLLVLFVPGFAWTFVFFGRLRPLERLALSVGLSMALVTLAILSSNYLLGIKITGTHSLIIIILITVAAPATLYAMRLKRRWRGKRRPGPGSISTAAFPSSDNGSRLRTEH